MSLMRTVTARLGRPELYTSYRQDMALLNTPAKKIWTAVIVLAGFALPFLLTDDLLIVVATGFVASIGAIGLNIVTGYAGQVSLGHAFFLALGAYTAAVLSGDNSRLIGFGITLLPVWLLASGLVAGLAGLLVAPLVVRLRGLYLAIVTLGLVFIGEHVFKHWKALTGGVGVGRPAAVPELFGIQFAVDGASYTKAQKLYLLTFVLLVVFGVLARNLVRSRTGRALAAVRDRDIAAEVIGVDITRYKAIAFAVSSFYAGVAGSLLYVTIGFVEPSSFSLGLSVQYIAMILIGGVATISGSIMGALFITLLPRLTRELPAVLPFISGSTAAGGLSVFTVETILYGLLIIVFLIFEPRGLFGIWVRIRNYWKSWPFSY
ncbi:MAG TPA: branched-chain amino acid ABC transporter permease [Kribbellaceae bacterium]|nr:branched-chain amino acid ABC transporter permease [Kribbellaceae bacterium]